MNPAIYLDAHATTPCDPLVVEAMLPLFTRYFGNASSRDHAYGWEAEGMVDRARDQVAALIGCSPREIFFTSGGTESDNLAIKGVAHAYASRGRHLIASAIEHHAVLASLESLRHEGFDVTLLPVGAEGAVNPAQLRAALRPDTILVSVMHANNEIGTLQPVREIGSICRENGVFFHCDASQSPAWEPIDVHELGVDLLTLSAHKMYGPKGIGALFVRRRNPRVKIEPLIDGGRHEQGVRSGTLNTPGIVGMGAAAALALERHAADATSVRGLRDRLQFMLLADLPGVRVNGSAPRLPNNVSIVIPGLDGENLAGQLRGLAVSAGSACMSVTREPSHVLLALGIPADLAFTSLRFGLHRLSTQAEIDEAARLVIEAAGRRLAARQSQAGVP